MSIRDKYKAVIQRFRGDFPAYAKQNLKIRTKAGDIVPFVLNAAQQIVNARIEQQLAETGRVRVLLLKGRQQGMSTYTGGRFYRNTTLRRGRRTYVMTHVGDATDTLFKLTTRYHKESNPYFRPVTTRDNAKELVFAGIDSSYMVATAGSRSIGRGDTIQYFHGSEVAFWPNAQDHFAGVMQAVPNEDGTEIILESTANGVGNMFHRLWQDAEKGLNEYLPVFVPWFLQDEYRTPVPDGTEFGQEERDYQHAHGLDDEQIYWRRMKQRELGEQLFRQEYPATPDEAFQNTGVDSFIAAADVLRARKASAVVRKHAPLLVGIDPAGSGKDFTSICFRQGATAPEHQRIKEPNSMAVVALIASVLEGRGLYNKYGVPDMAYIDIGYNPGIYDRLVELGHKNITPVNFGGQPDNKDRYVNKRAEMYAKLNDWLQDPHDQASIPDSDLLQGDLCAPGRKPQSNGKLLLESKTNLKQRIGRSPDDGDSLALTFAGTGIVRKGSLRHSHSGAYNAPSAASYL